MSEYQYYEFQAIDRPLTDQEQGTLRKYSSRAKITSSRFVVDYSWGDFKGNASEWMEKYFDAHLYFANWGTHELMLRVPQRVLPLETAKRYCAGDFSSARAEERARQKTERAAREKAHREREEDEARERHLVALAKREGEAWRELDALIATKQPKKYDEAITLLRDLRDVCVRAGRQAEAASRIARLQEEHAKKPSLIKRMWKAGLAT